MSEPGTPPDPFLTPLSNPRPLTAYTANTDFSSDALNVPHDQFIPPNPAFSRDSAYGIQPSLSSTPRGSTHIVSGAGGSTIGYPDDAPFAAPLLDHQQQPGQQTPPNFAEKDYGVPAAIYVDDDFRKKPLQKRPVFWAIVAASVVALVLIIVLPVYFTVVKPNNQSTSSPSSPNSNGGKGTTTSGGSASNPKPTNSFVVTGGDGSTITKDDGTTFTYHNKHGGQWYADPQDPYAENAQPNSWTPPLNQSWRWGVDRVYGVNLGGLFVLEPFISPALYQAYPGSTDEWTLAENLITAGNLTTVMEEHYSTFITEEDIAAIAGAGLNWIRLPIPFWAISAWDNVGYDDSGNVVSEPFPSGLCWKYILRVFGWARKYGLRINLDLHTAPGSQNGYNHSGRGGQINFLHGPMGIANAQRMLDYIRVFTEFISQPEYQNLVPIFSIVNEALITEIGRDQIYAFYLHAHDMIRGITGVGEGHGPYMAIHDGFSGLSSWSGFMPGSDRIMMDTHPYFAFSDQPNNEPVNVPADGDSSQMGGQWPAQACNAWGNSVNNSRASFGVTIAGEFSNAINDCGLFVRGVNNHASSAADCTFWSDASKWDDDTKAGMLNFALASMDALGDWFFWTWKIGESQAGRVESPLWSYKLGLAEGFMPTDPRQARGKCASLGVGASGSFKGTFEPWQTGGAGAGTIDAGAIAQYGVYPPTSIVGIPGPATLAPSYTATASITTLSTSPSPTVSGSAVSPKSGATKPGDGWFDQDDTTPMVTTIAGCASGYYLNAWRAEGLPVPVGGCAARGAGAPPPPPPTQAVPPTQPVPVQPTTDLTVPTTTVGVPLPTVTDPTATVRRR